MGVERNEGLTPCCGETRAFRERGSYTRDASGRLAGPGPRPPASGPPKLALLLLGGFWLVIGTLCVAAMYPNSNKFVAEEAAIVSHARRLLDDSATTTTTTT